MEYFNKNIDFNYEIIEKYETGIMLKGYETKSLRLGHCIIKNSFAKIIKNEIFLFNLNIPILDKNNFIKDSSDKERKLLMHKKEILKIFNKLKKDNLTLIPSKIYQKKNGKWKIEICLCKGKKLIDKKNQIKEKTLKREIEIEFKNQ